MIFLIVFAGLMYFTKKKVWKAGRARAERGGAGLSKASLTRAKQ